MSFHITDMWITLTLFSFVLCSLSHEIHTRICVQDIPNDINGENLSICFKYDFDNRSFLVWFNLNNALASTFDQFRFVLRVRDHPIAHGEFLGNITDFQPFDLENSVRLYKLDAGLYEVCVEFRMNQSNFIYEPRDGCVTMQVGQVSHRTYDTSSVPILVILGVAILIFFILGLTIPAWQKKRDQRRVASPIDRSKGKRELARALFQRHFEDLGQRTSLHRWARIQSLRHMHSTDPDEYPRRRLTGRWDEELIKATEEFVPDREVVRRNTEDRTSSVCTIELISKRILNYEEYPMQEIR